jgi:hypothetical protein
MLLGPADRLRQGYGESAEALRAKAEAGHYLVPRLSPLAPRPSHLPLFLCSLPSALCSLPSAPYSTNPNTMMFEPDAMAMCCLSSN